MSYAGSSSRPDGGRSETARTGRTAARDRGAAGEPAAAAAARGRPFAREFDLRGWGAVGSGVAIGALLGAGLALILAPRSGADTRRALGRVRRRAGHRAVDVWAELGDELWFARNRTRRGLRRRMERGRSRAEEVGERLTREVRRRAGRDHDDD